MQGDGECSFLAGDGAIPAAAQEARWRHHGKRCRKRLHGIEAGAQFSLHRHGHLHTKISASK
jgi:hypothetical protein